MEAFFGSLFFIILVVIICTLLLIKKCYKVVPSNMIIVVYGLVGKGRSAYCQHGGARIVWPIIQKHWYLELTPMTIDIFLENALSKQNIRVSVPSRFTIGISTDPIVMQAASERLLGMSSNQWEDNARDIIFGQLRATIATMNIEEINSDREAFEQKIMDNVEVELRKIGLKLINVNITDISDDSGYIDALGRKAASEAINRAKVEVAEQDRTGSIGEAEAKRDERVKVAMANATAVEGENIAEINIAQSNASREEALADANRRATAAKLVQKAKAEEEGYESQRRAEVARKAKEEAQQLVEIIVPAEMKKKKDIIEAETEALRMLKIAEGESNKIKLLAEAESIKMQKMGEGRGKEIELELAGRAEGNRQILVKQAEGLKSIVSSVNNNPTQASLMMIVDKIPEIVAAQAEAIKNIKIDKVTVWDSGANENGKNATANFINGFASSLPPLHDLLNNAGVVLPSYLGEALNEVKDKNDDTTD